jgi:hypothetical protein
MFSKCPCRVQAQKNYMGKNFTLAIKFGPKIPKTNSCKIYYTPKKLEVFFLAKNKIKCLLQNNINYHARSFIVGDLH